jgi:hypothetical protein
MRPVSRQCHAQPTGIECEWRCAAVADERVNHHDGFALETLRLICRADQDAWLICQAGGDRSRLIDMRRYYRQVARIQLPRVPVGLDEPADLQKLMHPIGSRGCNHWIRRPAEGRDQVGSQLG